MLRLPRDRGQVSFGAHSLFRFARIRTARARWWISPTSWITAPSSRSGALLVLFMPASCLSGPTPDLPPIPGQRRGPWNYVPGRFGTSVLRSKRSKPAIRTRTRQMANERLRSAMAKAGKDIANLADATAVDPKTVQRWLAGRVPHPRHRWVIASLVEEDEGHLWPSA